MDEILFNLILKNEFEKCIQTLTNDFIIQPSLKNFKLWQVFYLPSSGPYSGYKLTFSINFEGFPNKIPHIIFQSGILHPLINPNTSDFHINLIFPEWNSKEHIYSLLVAINDSFLNIVPINGAPNIEANTLLLKSNELFIKYIKEHPPLIPTPEGLSDINFPKRWNDFKEKKCLINK